jgi:uncharacterized protein (TIGR02001 family)
MKTLFKAIAVASLATATAAQAELSASVAVDSEYVFRGVTLDSDATTSATLEYAISGLTVGAWIADDEAGETDLYVSYGLNAGGVDLGLSYTDYSYNDASGGQQEIAVSASVKGLGLNYVDGSDDQNGADGDYDVITLDYTFGNVNVLVGQVDYDAADYSYFEISGSLGQIAGVDASLTLTGTFDESDATVAAAQEANIDLQDSIVIGFSKAFDL